jgi:CheY-like chemotaxis protein
VSYRALIVEDEPEVIDAVVEILDSLDHPFDTACSQTEAMRRVRETDYSYILLDMEIPARSRTGTPRIQNSENFLERLNALKNGDCPPVIVICDRAAGEADLNAEMMQLVAAVHRTDGIDFITKPFPPAGRTLDRVIKKVLGIARPRDQRREPPGQLKEEPSRRAPAAQEDAVPDEPEEAEAWPGIPDEPVTLDEFMAKYCEQRSKSTRRYRRKALLAAARNGTVSLPRLAAAHKSGQAKRYLAHDLLSAWPGFIDEGVDLPPLHSRRRNGS